MIVESARQVKQADDLEEVLVAKFMRFLMQRAEQFIVLRRKPVEVPPLALPRLESALPERPMVNLSMRVFFVPSRTLIKDKEVRASE